MTLAQRSASALAVVMLTLALAGCGGEGDTADAAAPAQGDAPAATAAPADDTSAPAQHGGVSGGACPSVPQDGYELYGSDLVTVAPVDGAVYGDGTPISWTFAAPPDGTLGLDMSYVNEAGDAIPMGGVFLEDFGDNEWGSTLNVFTSDADGRPGFMFLGLTKDTTTTVLGVYCVSFKVAP